MKDSERDVEKVKSDRGFATFRREHNLPHRASEIIGWQNKKKNLVRDYSRREWDSQTIMTGKKFDFNKTVKVCTMKVYTIWMQVMSVKDDLDLASILHISLLCDKLSLFYQNSSLVTLGTNVTVWLNSSLFAIILHFTSTSFLLILRRWLVNYCRFLFCFCI